MRNLTALHLIAILAISLLGTIVYSNTFDSPFVLDDKTQITWNGAIRITEISGQSLYSAAFESPLKARPFANASFALNYYFGEYNVFGYHLTNLAIHLINGILVYFLAFSIFQYLQKKEHNAVSPGPIGFFDSFSSMTTTPIGPSLVAALIFTAHPIQTQAITYVVQRMTSLAVLFYLLSFLLYFLARLKATSTPSNAAHRNRTIWLLFLASFASWIMALGNKEIAATLPVIVVLAEWYFFQDLSKRWLFKGMTYAIGAGAVVFALAIIFVGDNPLDRILAGYSYRDFTLEERLLTQSRIVMLYISLIFLPLPSRLNLDHDIPLSIGLFTPATTALSIAAIFAFVYLIIYLAKKERLISFAILWFFFHLILESTILPLELIFEHRLYLPMVGVSLATAYFIFKLATISRASSLLVFLIITVSLSVGTYNRNETWQDKITLWSDAIDKSPNSVRSYTARGIAYQEQENHQLAIEDFSRIALLDPDDESAYLNRGHSLAAQGKYQEALADFTQSIKLNEDFERGYISLGNTLIRFKQYDQAIAAFTKAIELGGGSPVIYNNRANALKGTGNYGRAISDYKAAILLESNFPAAHNGLAYLLATAPNLAYRNGEKAVKHAILACELTEWRDFRNLDTLAAAYAESLNFPKAVEWQAQAISFAPDKYKPALIAQLNLYKQRLQLKKL